MSKDLRIILSGGGTGGHIYPAIAIADEVKRRYPDAQIKFVGAQDKMEMEKVPQAGYEIEGLWISGLQRKLTLKNLMFPFKLISSIRKSQRIIKDFKPNVAVGTGGFASGPLLHVANKQKIPTLLQEQNSFPGITNKILAKKANIICAAYDEVKRFFPQEKVKKTGNPVRQDLLNIDTKREEAQQFFKLDADKKTVLVLGGSLGARRVNQLIAEYADKLKKEDIQLIWQCGKLYYEDYKSYTEGTVQVHQFLNRMDLAYAAADVIISRAGAGSVSELCIVGKPVIFIPSPNVAEDHQTKNAMAVTKNEAAITIAETQLEEKFESAFFDLLENQSKQKELSRNIKKMALPNATSSIVDEIEKLIIRKA
ncbi:undecaprenyldiphospho-muramoylpentapeptide beta-N-acetylglucosaminyltransferase [Zunongwangia profunda]|uniref:UDP-N-acetylglucosamine--N-acetylmuramyl-(pentapeptide) pyrophosphoryl-undecaprenol N-acetylglucosamine transferase n=3 Tax=Zunongwangia profunda TaxID=398743 RepID=D5BLI8_ZUNPS|nr:undecaprenyldiphospho-muramoylpentapeptide beta-N-acetylglucosaminyltransferase [Zunongwangia profunda]ADF54114.1 N-acetylglucosaminyl transferase [Zunongwangia profunda SM-A87]MAS72324.1 undecaprenyldiphospho-muramoylpentapeptide beta-N-acetylglucosaminyltransferase [Zunongwangia sp.]HCV81698.1 undecaprenyldiphospho-muramoylpentapeptide beta-N-acetylglucosaminyltransferase [Zunongwangia profunda]|tara:strand:- start:6046 stop:7146 length:1101 start_codon:yes stop_codon:yes gene_type:complete